MGDFLKTILPRETPCEFTIENQPQTQAGALDNMHRIHWRFHNNYHILATLPQNPLIRGPGWQMLRLSFAFSGSHHMETSRWLSQRYRRESCL